MARVNLLRKAMTFDQVHNPPLISVCVPVFNGENYIRSCIASVIAQSERNFELVIIDNCSTDRTLSICREFTDPRIRVLKNSDNVGSNENFNKCIRNAIGEFFLLLPADDLLERECLKLLSTGLIENPSVGIAFGSSIQIDDRGKFLGVRPASEQAGVLDCAKAIRMIAEKFSPVQHPMVRSKVFSQVGGFNKRFGCFCDIHLWSRVLFHGWDAYYINKPLTSIRQYENQGQSLFRQNTRGNLRKLSSHYGRPLAPTFYKKNHYNLLFFWFVRFFHRRSKLVTEARYELTSAMMINLVRSHLSNTYYSIRHVNLRSLGAEIALALRLLKVFGLALMIRSYLSAVVSVFKHSVSRSNL